MKLLDSDSEPQVSPKKSHIEPKENVSQFLDLEAGVSPGCWSSDEELPEEEDVMIMEEEPLPKSKNSPVVPELKTDKRHYRRCPIQGCMAKPQKKLLNHLAAAHHEGEQVGPEVGCDCQVAKEGCDQDAAA